MKSITQIPNLQLAGYNVEAVYEWVKNGHWTVEDFNKYIDALKKKHEWVGAWSATNEKLGLNE
jgi:hypothetical protein